MGSLSLSSAMSLSLAPRSGGGAPTPTPTPSPTPTPVTYEVYDGDSNLIAAAGGGPGSWANRMIVANPGSPASNLSSGGASWSPTWNPTNNLYDRLATAAALNPSHYYGCAGTNDLTDARFSGEQLLDYVGLTFAPQFRSLMPTTKFLVAEVPPSASANRNARRAVYNAGLRTLLANGIIDGIIPIGTHPLLTDAAGSDPKYFYDTLHGNGEYHRLCYLVFKTVRDPLVAQSTATSPTLGLFDVNHAELSSDNPSQCYVTGLQFNRSCGIAKTAGIGDFKVGAGASITSGGSVINGDVVTSRLPASASNDTALTQTLTAGSTVKTITVRTKLATYQTVTMTLDPAAKYAGIALTNGNLTAAGEVALATAQVVRSTQQPETRFPYFETTDTAASALMAVFNTALGISANAIPGYSGGNANNGVSVSRGSPMVVYHDGGTGISTKDGVSFGNAAAGSVLGMAIDCDAGVVWIRTAAGWINGDPELRDGGFRLAAPLAQHWLSTLPRSTSTSTVNYGASAFSLNGGVVPKGFLAAGLRAPDVTAPTLSSPTDAANGSTGGTLSVSTNEANGTLYWFVSTSATPPSVANLKAGTGAVSFGNQAVTTTGVQNANATGLTASTTYYAHFVHTDSSSNNSSIASGDGFTTASGVTYFVSDDFTEASDTALTAHTPNVGGAWSLLNANTLTVVGSTDKVKGNGSATGLAVNAATPPSPNYEVEAVVSRISGVDDYVGLLIRAVDATNLCALYYINGSGWQLQVVVGGSIVASDVDSATFSLATDYTLRLTANGTTFKGYLDGVEILSCTTSSLAAAGKAGLRSRENGRVDTFRAYQ